MAGSALRKDSGPLKPLLTLGIGGGAARPALKRGKLKEETEGHPPQDGPPYSTGRSRSARQGRDTYARCASPEDRLALGLSGDLRVVERAMNRGADPVCGTYDPPQAAAVPFSRAGKDLPGDSGCCPRCRRGRACAGPRRSRNRAPRRYAHRGAVIPQRFAAAGDTARRLANAEIAIPLRGRAFAIFAL